MYIQEIHWVIKMAKQSLTTRVKELTAKVASLEQKNEELECTVKDLKLQISKINKFIQNKFGKLFIFPIIIL